jgi:hypothetical protein
MNFNLLLKLGIICIALFELCNSSSVGDRVENKTISTEEICEGLIQNDTTIINEIVKLGIDISDDKVFVPLMSMLKVKFIENLLKTSYSEIPEVHHQLFKKAIVSKDYELMSMLIDVSSHYLLIKNDEYINLIFEHKCYKILEKMASHGFDPNVEISTSNSIILYPLHFCVYENLFVTVKALLSFPNIYVNLATADGRTPIHFSDSYQLSELLLDHGADFSIRNSDGELAIAAEIHLGSRERMVELIPELSLRQSIFCSYYFKLFTSTLVRYANPTIHRDSVLEDTLKFSQEFGIFYYDEAEKLKISFKGEDVVDAGGPRREYYSLFAERLFNSRFAYNEHESKTGESIAASSPDFIYYKFAPFECVDESNKIYRISRTFDGPIEIYKVIGAYLAKTLLQKISINAKLAPSLIHLMLGKDSTTLSFDDLAADDPVLHRHLSEILDPNFDFESADLSLLSDETVPVTADNASRFLYESAQEAMYLRYKNQIDLLVEGFRGCLDPNHVKTFFNVDEVQLLWLGEQTINREHLKKAVVFSGTFWSQNSELFWNTIEELNDSELMQLIRFVTGVNGLPHGGVKIFYTNSIKIFDSAFPIPSAATCSFRLSLPIDVETSAELAGRIRIALSITKRFAE